MSRHLAAFESLAPTRGTRAGADKAKKPLLV
jgi:hypothetical protein